MPQHLQQMNHSLQIVFLALQVFSVLFLLLHDWIPLGRLNNIASTRGQDTILRTVIVTLLPVIPAAVCLYFSTQYFGQPYPHWLNITLWITYGALFYGLLRAWWIPYLFVPEPQRAARYQIIFANTHSFLPRRNGIVPDTLHVTFHLAVVAILGILVIT